MPSMHRVRLFVVLLLAATLAGAQERAELLASPKLEEDARIPAFAELTAEQVAAQIRMVSGRNYAVFGFNTPEIHVVLPAADNSVYADVDFGEPKLYDTAGNQVAYEAERGLYDHDTHHVELRFAPSEGERPVEFARAVGTATVRYPLRLHTLVARAGGPAVEGLDVSIDGPFVVRRSSSKDEDLEAASFTHITALRALDAEGHVLTRHPSTQFRMADGVTTETLAFWGEVAAVQLDVADEWATFRVAYELPEVPPLPDSRLGSAPADGDENPPTPGAKVAVEVVAETPGTAIAAELGITADEALARLRKQGYQDANGEFMVLSAVKGDAEAVKLFLAAGSPIDYATADGRTALLSALMYGRFDLARFLVDAGADVNIADSNNATPLFHAASNCTATDLVKALLAAGADPTQATRGKTTAAEMAAAMGCTDNEAAIRAAPGR
ncbi:MAG: ankyrin repeat domain-containing protein [Acidobacteriota bacterium]